ncbi:low affinity immunoglobulin gamma Fc region receptor II-like isoform X1 [Acanthochromis polyacanthus]|uniref:low affinity immunoglobulin gamma Fc region receptor II-like isoform X1 n=1 Tax=Acanthochromis polyacanthus TaxID=80966 RepID=UPI0022346185|nr:low affinity immunoglobulin gamma Fc region receptor II-like isoform X1 [Acanthochromis polyacanthus]
MEVTALCIRLLVDVFVLLAAQVDHSYSAQKADTVFLRVDPKRLQVFEYKSFSVTCEGIDGVSEWRVMRKLQKASEANSSSNTCISLESSCTFDPAFRIDSGEYWCENEDGRTSDTVNITVAGSVMLEIPEQPVMEGDDVTLRCINKKTKSKDTVDFYKDGIHLKTRYDDMIYIIQSVSKSNEGLYKCNIPGYGESPKMWLAVEKQKTVITEPPKDIELSDSDVPETPMLWIVGVLLVALLLLLMGALLCSKHKVCLSSGKSSPGRDDNTVLREDNVTDPHHATYAVVNKQRKRKGGDDPNHMTYSFVTMSEPSESSAATSALEEGIIYSSVSINRQVMRAANEPCRKDNDVIYSSINRK